MSAHKPIRASSFGDTPAPTSLPKLLPATPPVDTAGSVPAVVEPGDFMASLPQRPAGSHVDEILRYNRVDRDTGDTPKVRRRAKGILMAAAMRATVGTRVVVPLPANVFDAYTRHCAKGLLNPQDGIVESAHKLAKQLMERPECLMLDQAEGKRVGDWFQRHGIRYQNIRIHKDTVRLLEDAQAAHPHAQMSRQQLAARAILNACESAFASSNG